MSLKNNDSSNLLDILPPTSTWTSSIFLLEFLEFRNVDTQMLSKGRIVYMMHMYFPTSKPKVPRQIDRTLSMKQGMTGGFLED